ncbi:hypothetical protein B0H11DRAFT_1923999 [Mycena galericulata]|nr:hypothetical protein B0H11DRAFT_1923999 [Mycena galericulata]
MSLIIIKYPIGANWVQLVANYQIRAQMIYGYTDRLFKALPGVVPWECLDFLHCFGTNGLRVRTPAGKFTPEYQLWKDYLYLRPYWAPPPAEDPLKPWVHLTFGVDSKISASFKEAPTSGILGLGRRTVQIRPVLVTARSYSIEGLNISFMKGEPRDDDLIGRNSWAATHWLGPTEYYVGALQPKSLLMTGHGSAYHGPDLIGRVALVNMQIVLQFPENKAHTMSWQRKKTNFAGPSTQHW